MINFEKAQSHLKEHELLSAAAFLNAPLEINDLLETELAERQRRNVEVRSKLARLPYKKTLKGWVNLNPLLTPKGCQS